VALELEAPAMSQANPRLTVLILAVPAVVALLVAGYYLGASVAPAPRRDLPPPTARSDCPELAYLNPALIDLPIETLESQLVTGSGLPPTSGKEYLESLRGSLSTWAPEKRQCMYRVMLINAHASSAFVRRVPGNWGLDKPSPEIARMFFELPTQRPLSREQREDLLAQVEEYVIPHLQAQGSADREHWRRQYYGLLLTCEVTDEVLSRLEARRPRECLRFSPRTVPQPWRQPSTALGPPASNPPP
jgi:hypothetical protein